MKANQTGYRLLQWIVIVFSITFILGAQAAELKNKLKHHPAPYLALHGEDPVAWQVWDKETVDRARQDNKLLFLSVGYFACHWCHVMQRESYQDQGVAEILNDDFISVKIDRELEPALDNRLMDFAQRTIHRGGWPLNVFITPEGHPVYALLYAPREQFELVLARLQEIWKTDPDKVRSLVAAEAVGQFPLSDPEIDIAVMQTLIDQAAAKILTRGDTFDGGFGSQNKFPSASQMQFLLDSLERRPQADNAEEVKNFVLTSLNAMAYRGMRDHLAGGFFRYTVDPGWEIPHFEKMLYDNASLARLYLRAGQFFGRQDYLDIGRNTLEFMRERMWLGGGLVASFSAVDDDGIEGGHYLWQRDQLKAVLNEQEFILAAGIWGLDRPDELEAGNQPRWNQTLESYSASSGQALKNVVTLYQGLREKLLEVRNSRSLPVDDKLLAGWNALALSAFVDGAKAFPESSFRENAAALAEFLGGQLWDGKELVRSRTKGQILGTASLEDYAYVSRAIWDYAELTGDDKDFQIAEDVMRAGWSRFYVNNTWHQEDDSLLAPPSGTEVMEDGPSPAPAAVMIETGFKIATRAGDADWLQTIYGTVNRGKRELQGAPYWYVSQLSALQTVLDGLR